MLVKDVVVLHAKTNKKIIKITINYTNFIGSSSCLTILEH